MEGHSEVVMDRHVFLALASMILADGCDKKAGGAADDTGTKERERGASALQQANSRADLDTTQAIRKGLMADDTLSFDAKNVQVVTTGGVVTLRGPVKNQAERAAVEDIARRNAAGNRGGTQLTVATPDTQQR